MDSIKYKYPRTYHVPWSENLQNDDRCHPCMDWFDNEVVVVTEKLDGECTTMYPDAIHARSIDSQNANHPSRDMVKSMWAIAKNGLMPDMRLCGENMYALHSLEYNDLESYFYVFSSWNGNSCQSWEDTLKLIGNIKLNQCIELITPPLLYYGIYDKDKIHNSWLKYKENLNRDSEGYVMRVSEGFYFDFEQYNFFAKCAKYVRENHVQTDEHWLRSWNKTKINKLKSV